MYRINESINHLRSSFLNPMIVVDVDPYEVLSHLKKTSDALDNFSEENIEINEIDKFVIDPGGILFGRIPYAQFEIDGNKFEVQMNKISEALILIRRATQRFPNAMRFQIFNGLAIISNELFDKLITKLEELETSDKAIHAMLDQYETQNYLEGTGGFHFTMPRERTE